MIQNANKREVCDSSSAQSRHTRTPGILAAVACERPAPPAASASRACGRPALPSATALSGSPIDFSARTGVE
jgi:hypothetical protein